MLNKGMLKGLFDSIGFWAWKLSKNKYLYLVIILLPLLAVLFGACNRGGGESNRSAHP
jgi:hypothetical protein